jgi:hypothetical protein
MPTMPFAPPAGPPVSSPVDVPPPAQPTVPAQPAVEPETRTTPPAWDPLGAAPFAWDLPEPSTPEPEEPAPPKRRKPKVGTATLGIALVAAAGLALAGNAAWGGWITPQHAVGVVLAIVGLGLVAGAFLRAGRGLIALAVPLSVAGMALTTMSPGGYHGLGDLTARPTTIEDVQSQYERSVGSVQLDLTELPAEGQVFTSAHTNLGSIEITVPANADVTYRCLADVGNAECLGQETTIPGGAPLERTDYGPDGPGGLKIDLTASVDTGSVEVRRG